MSAKIGALLLCILTLLSGCNNVPQTHTFSCAYVPAVSSVQPEPELTGYDGCGHYDNDDQPVFTSLQEKQIRAAAQQSLLCIYLYANGSNRVFYRYQDRFMETLYFDNGCDYIREGLARAFVNKQLVFVDERLNVVLRPDAELATPFWAKHTIVCDGPYSSETIGEHLIKRGGKCGLMDRQGKLVMEKQYPMQSEKFDHYILHHNGCPPPPLNDTTQILCHARWQGTLHEYLPEQARFHTLTADSDNWVVEYHSTEEGLRFIIELGRQDGTMQIMRTEPLQK